MNPLRVCLIGGGTVSDVHAEGYFKIPEKAKVVAICDIREEIVRKKAEEWRIGKWFTDYREVMESDDVDAVDVMVPHDEHLNMVKAACSNGKHILLEKPIARNLEEADKIIETVNDSNARMMIANNLLFHPAIEKLDSILKGGMIGSLVHIEAYSLGWFFYFKPYSFRLSLERSGGGALIDTGNHFIYLLRFLFGEIITVSSFQSNILNDQHDFTSEGDDVSVSIFQFENGVLGNLTISYSTKLPAWQTFFPTGWDQAIHAYGSEGAARINLPGDKVMVFSDKKEYVDESIRGWVDLPMEDVGGAFASSYHKEVEHFADCIQSGKEFRKEVTAESSKRDLKIIVSAYESNKTGKVVKL